MLVWYFVILEIKKIIRLCIGFSLFSIILPGVICAPSLDCFHCFCFCFWFALFCLWDHKPLYWTFHHCFCWVLSSFISEHNCQFVQVHSLFSPSVISLAGIIYVSLSSIFWKSFSFFFYILQFCSYMQTSWKFLSF